MFHIILAILKVIGIMIGILLLILLAVLLSLVFVPVRYRLAAVRTPQRTEISLRGSWLLCLVSVSAAVGPAGRTTEVRLFGIRLPLFGAGGGEKERAGGGKREKGAKSRAPEEDAPEESRAEPPEEPAAQENAPEESPAEPPEMPAAQESAPEESRAGQSETPAGSEEDAPEEDREDGPEAPPLLSGEPVADREAAGKREKDGIFRKIWFQCKNICDRIKKIPQRAGRFWRRLEELARIVPRTAEKISGILQKPGELLEMAEEYELKAVAGGLLGHLIFLAGHYKPRRIRGYLRFGTGDPASTGLLTGLVYLLLPARVDRFTVTPEFYEAAFETETVCFGHIRALHLLRVLWRAFRDRRLRKIIDKLRKRGDS